MSRIHFWEYLVDESGVPISDAEVYFYLAGGNSSADIFSSSESTTIINSVPANHVNYNADTLIKTDSDGYFSFWLEDEWGTTEGAYSTDQRFKVAWYKIRTVDAYIDNITVFPTIIHPVDETDVDATLDKLVSNNLAKTWTDHISATGESHTYIDQDVTTTGTPTFSTVTASAATFEEASIGELTATTSFSCSAVDITGGTISGVVFDDLPMLTITDPAASAASNTDAIDNYNGVIVTLTVAGNDQGLEDPSDISPGKRWIAVNNDTSTDNIDFDNITLEPGEVQKFIWDGTNWVVVEAVDASDITFIPTGDFVATNVQDAIDENADDIGTLGDLTTTAKGDLVLAINEVDGHADTNASDITTLETSAADFDSRIDSLELSAGNYGTMATQDADAVNIDGGTIDGVTIGGDVPAIAIDSDEFGDGTNYTISWCASASSIDFTF